MVETESMQNCRPLTHAADVPENEEPITPNHFLVQRLYNSRPPGDFSSTMPASFKSWKNVQQLMNHVWRRLVKERLPTLTKRSKWSEQNDLLKVNDLMWILKDLTPRAIWPLGRIVETSLGKDGSLRAVKVKTAYGTYVHPVAGLARVLANFSFSERKSRQRELPSGLSYIIRPFFGLIYGFPLSGAC